MRKSRFLQMLIADLRARGAPMSLSWADRGSPGIKAYKLTIGATKTTNEKPIIVTTNHKFDLTGIQISVLTQPL